MSSISWTVQADIEATEALDEDVRIERIDDRSSHGSP
jgi:hypothetical protein